MATFTFPGVHERFPIGTTVAVHELKHRHPNMSGPPVEAATTQVTSAVVDADGLALAGLADDHAYVAYAEVSGAHLYLHFKTTPATV